jgi:hypothetical protein
MPPNLLYGCALTIVVTKLCIVGASWQWGGRGSGIVHVFTFQFHNPVLQCTMATLSQSLGSSALPV